MKGWLDNYGKEENPNEIKISGPSGSLFSGVTTKGRNYSPAWGGQFQYGGSTYGSTGTANPGSIGFTYARIGAPSNGKNAKKTLASAQGGKNINPKTLKILNDIYKRKQAGKTAFDKTKVKDERAQSVRPSESTSVKKVDSTADFRRKVAAENKAVNDYRKLTPEQKARMEYEQQIQQQGNISKYTPESGFERAKQIGVNPLTAFGYLARGENLPGNFAAGPRNTLDNALDWINPIQGVAALSDVPGQLGEGDFTGAGLSVLDALDLAPGVKKAYKASKVLGKENGLLSKTYKLNPWAIKENPESFLYRARPIGQDVNMNMAAQIRAKQAAGENIPWWQKNILTSDNPGIQAREKYYGQWFDKDPSRLQHYLDPGTTNFAEGAPLEILRTKLPTEEAARYNVGQFEDANRLSLSPETEFVLPKETIEGAERFPAEDWQRLIQEHKEFNTPHWLKGYKEAPKPTVGKDISQLSYSDADFPYSKDPGVLKLMEKVEKQKQAQGAIDFMKEDLADPETIRRMDAMGIDTELFGHALKNTEFNTERFAGSHYDSTNQSINIDPEQIAGKFTGRVIGAHEPGHMMQNQSLWKKAYDKILPKGINVDALTDEEKVMGQYKDYSSRITAPTDLDKKLGALDMDTDLLFNFGSEGFKNYGYFANANRLYGTAVDNMIERLPMFREYRQGMRDSGILKNKWDVITPEHIDEYAKLNPTDRLNSIMGTNLSSSNKKLLGEISKIAPAAVPVAGVAAASQLGGGEEAPQYQQGGIIDDDMGQWAHPGEVTRINSNDITMMGVPYDVLGISDTGDRKLMKPGKNYKFKGNKVTELPISKDGSQLVKLDQLTNFTNYNKKQPGGWLDQL